MANEIPRINRNALSEFIKDQDTLRKFERIIEVVSVETPEAIEAGGAIVGTAMAKANQALDLLQFFKDMIELAALAPPTMGDNFVADNSVDAPQLVTGWNDLHTSMKEGKVTGPASPTWASWAGTNFKTQQFSASTKEFLQLDPIHMDHFYKPGSDIFPHVHWMPDDTNTGVVRWELQFSLAKGHSQEAFNPVPTTVIIEQAGSGTQYMHQTAEKAIGETLASLEPDALFQVIIARDGAHIDDTYTGVAHGLFVDLHYEMDRLATKNRAPNFYI